MGILYWWVKNYWESYHWQYMNYNFNLISTIYIWTPKCKCMQVYANIIFLYSPAGPRPKSPVSVVQLFFFLIGSKSYNPPNQWGAQSQNNIATDTRNKREKHIQKIKTIQENNLQHKPNRRQYEITTSHRELHDHHQVPKPNQQSSKRSIDAIKIINQWQHSEKSARCRM